jgi:hypothetical protein
LGLALKGPLAGESSRPYAAAKGLQGLLVGLEAPWQGSTNDVVHLRPHRAIS